MLPIAMNDQILLDHLASIRPDGLTIFSLGGEGNPRTGGRATGGELRGALLHGTGLVARMRAQHDLGILETLVLGQAYLAALLIASTLKGRDKIVLRLDCEGKVKGFSVEGRAALGAGGARRNEARGYLFEDHIPLEARLESFDLSAHVGKGSLSMTRFIDGAPRPFTGAIELHSGRLASELASYYLESEQTKTAFDLSVCFDREGRVSGAAAIFLQALPGARPDFVANVEAGLLGLPSLGPWFSSGKDGATLLHSAFPAHDLRLLEVQEADFACDCSRERFASFLSNASEELLKELAEEGPWPVETECHNCASTYVFSQEELTAMARKRGILA